MAIDKVRAASTRILRDCVSHRGWCAESEELLGRCCWWRGGRESARGEQTARMHAAYSPPRRDMLPRLHQVAVQPIETKREPLAWVAVRNAEPRPTAIWHPREKPNHVNRMHAGHHIARTAEVKHLELVHDADSSHPFVRAATCWTQAVACCRCAGRAPCSQTRLVDAEAFCDGAR
jgi:hypothetical protein